MDKPPEKENLTQKDIDELLSEIQKESEPAAQPESELTERTVFKYNFKSQKKINKGQILLLENIHKRFLRNIEGSLTNLLNVPVVAELSTATELRYKEFADAISSPSCLFLLDVVPGLGKFVLEVDLNFAFFVIDKVLGGNQAGNAALNRELSLIEERIMFRIVRLFLKELEDAWQMVESVKFEINGFYSQADYIQVIAAEEKVFLVTVDIRSDKNIGFLNLCMPLPILDYFIAKYRTNQPRLAMNRTREEIQRDRTTLVRQVRRAPVRVQAVLGRADVSVEELLRLRVGDVIRLNSRRNQPIDVLVGGSRIFQGVPFRHDHFVTIKISDEVA